MFCHATLLYFLKKKCIYYISRGDDLDFSIRRTTETDSIKKKEPEILPQPIVHTKPVPLVDNIRSQEDLVVCYSTLSGNIYIYCFNNLSGG